MYPSAHFSSGIVVVAILRFLNVIPLTIVPSILLGVVLPDFDFILNRWVPNNNHRRLITHTPVLWIGISLIDYFLLHTGFIFWISLAALFHLVLDLFDWGIMISFPFSKEINRHLLHEANIDFSSNNSRLIQCNFLEEYFKNKCMVCIELSLGVVAFMGVLIFFNLLAIYFLIYITIVVGEVVALLNICKKRV